MNTLSLHSRTAILLSFVLLVAACSQVPSPQVSKTPTINSSTPTVIATLPPTPTVTATPLGGASAKLGPVPQNCPPGPAPKDIDPSFGSAVGASKVWGVGFIGPHATLVWLPTQADELHNQNGWPHKLLWVVDDSVKGLVTIHGANLRDGSPLYPDSDGAAPMSTPTSLVLDVGNPNVMRADQWDEFPGGLTIPKAGCYSFVATWPGGSWRITFAAGEVASDG